MTITMSTPYLPLKESYLPTHPDLFLVKFAEGDFNSSLVTQRSFPASSIICPITNTFPAYKAYSSVQVLPDPPIHKSQKEEETRHIELNSDLLFVNHSCDPNVAFEVPSNGEWCVRALKDLKKGEIMTFAYFSTEWFMDQPFKCLCGTTSCLGEITGAQAIPQEVLSRYFINQHIRDLKAHQMNSLKAVN